MRDRLDDLGSRTAVALVTFSDVGSIHDYLRRHDLPFPVLVDANRASYRSYGLGRGSLTRVWGIRAARRWIELLREGGVGAMGRPTEDTLQLGGDFVIDSEGRLAWGFWGEGPDDRPAVDELVDAVKACQP